MKLILLNSSIVVLAEAHNPTILHPAFLNAEGIVPGDWKLAEPPVCTAAIAVVKYSNGVVFTAELNKLMVVDNNNASGARSPIPGLAIKYVEKLPHVRYTAAGINFTGHVPYDDPDDWMVERFIHPGIAGDPKLRPRSAAVKFAYELEDCLLQISCESGSVQNIRDKSDTPSLLISANYHNQISPPQNALESIRHIVNMFGNRLAHFEEMAQTVLGFTTETHAKHH